MTKEDYFHARLLAFDEITESQSLNGVVCVQFFNGQKAVFETNFETHPIPHLKSLGLPLYNKFIRQARETLGPTAPKSAVIELAKQVEKQFR